MPVLYTFGDLRHVLIGLAGLAVLTSASPARAESLSLDAEVMADAVRYLSVLAGRELLAEDTSWLQGQWTGGPEASQRSVAAEVDDLAFSFQRHQRDEDPIRLAQARARIVKSTYCAAEQSSDPAVHRLKDTLAPEDLVLAADCVLGLVVTRFDVDGLVASHGLTASVTGLDHDGTSDREETVAAITDGFAEATPDQKKLMADGEIRHAVLERFWRLIEGSPEQAALVQEFSRVSEFDVRASARELETLALSKLGEVDAVARVGKARLTAGSLSIYDTWLERIAGYRFDDRDRDWLHQAVVRDFEEDPKKVLDEVAGIEVMNRDFVLLDTGDEKKRRVQAWAASLHCYLTSSEDPDERHLAEIVFREDPVLEADCGAGSVQRRRQTVLAEAGGQTLLVEDLDPPMQFSKMILGRALSPEDVVVVQKDTIETFENDPAVWREENDQFQALLQAVEKHDSSAFLGMDERKKLFDPIYCGLKTSDKPYAEDYLAMFEKEDAILFDDCDRELVTTEDEIQAVVAVANFLALLNEQPPLDEAAVEDMRNRFKSQPLDEAESSMLALKEWWSLLSLEEKAKAKRITIEADAEAIAGYVNNAKLQVVLRNAKMQSCRMSSIILQGQTAIFAARHGPYTAAANNPLGISGMELGGLIATAGALGELCKNVPGG